MDSIVSIEEQNFTIIGKNCNLNGTFKFNGATHLAGKIDGEIHMADNSQLTFESTSKITGNIYCENLKIYGQVDGEVHAKGLVEVFPSGTLTGLIKAKNLIVHPGAVLNFDGHTQGN